MKYRDKGKLQPPTAQGGEYIYSPPAWQVCGECSNGQVFTGSIGLEVKCPKCNGTGRIPIYYTPEQWTVAGGVLTDYLPVWVLDEAGHILLPFKAGKDITLMNMIVIATEAGRPPEDYRP